MSDLHQELASRFSGPLLFDYVWWVLHEAKRRGLERLYFLARDGYTLHRIAKQFCERFDLGIECRYLYCSRASLRMPSYFLIGDEAFDLLLLRGYYTTLRTILERGGLTAEEREAVYAECGIQGTDENQPISHAEFGLYAGLLRKSRLFRSYVLKRSRLAYADAIGYFKAEGLLEQSTVAVVDSGWTGSMQRSLRQLLEFSGFQGTLAGFYFGMYAYPKIPADGGYYTWYFNADSNLCGKVQFCNNLFECLLSAPHGMTVSYRKNGDRYEPVLLPPPAGKELKMIEAQSEAICSCTAKRLEQAVFEDFDARRLRRETRQLVRQYMFLPTEEEAVFYGQFLFCDDVTEAYHISLAEGEQKVLLKQYFIPRRILSRLVKRPAQGKRQELFWPFGTIAFLPPGKRWWYRWNVCVWEWLRYTLQRHRKRPLGREECSISRHDLETYDVISFDIFDTLLYRVLNQPTDVFRLMEPEVEEKFGIPNFAEKRVAAEQTARCRTAEEEVTFAEIYEELHVDRDTANALMRLEQEMELSVLRCDPVMAGLLADGVALGKRVLILSDMYQEEAFLRTVLEQAGVCGYHALYVSSTEKATKASGSLFRQVAGKERITNQKRWLHIGDNFHSDYAVPKALGLSAKRYDNGRGAQKPRTLALRMVQGIKMRVRNLR